MQIDVTTVYTKKRLLRFNYYVAAQKKLLWIAVIITTVFAIAELVAGNLSSDTRFIMYMLLFFDFFEIFLYLVLPIISVNKSKNKNVTIHYSFTENEIRTHFDTGAVNEAAVRKYDTLVKLVKNKNDLYLFIDKNHAFLVDVSALDAEQLENLKVILASKLSSKKFNWK